MNTAVSANSPLSFDPLGEFAILCQANAEGDLLLPLQQRIWALAAEMTQSGTVTEAVPGMNNLLLIFPEPVVDFDAVTRAIQARWLPLAPHSGAGKLITVPVVYGGSAGFDLEDVARTVGLSPKEYAQRHAQGTYQVYALGSQPGFAYLGGLDAALAVPRRSVPRPRVEEGTIIIGGPQTGIQSRTTPSGWHVIGRTTLRLFDPASSPPALLQPGDTVRFDIQELLS